MTSNLTLARLGHNFNALSMEADGSAHEKTRAVPVLGADGIVWAQISKTQTEGFDG